MPTRFSQSFCARARTLRSPLALAGLSAVALGVLSALTAASAFAVDRKAHKVSGPSVVGSDVFWLGGQSNQRISPDGEWIVWVQDAEVNNAHALWAARRWGGPVKRLSGTLAPGDVFERVMFSPDSKYVLYTAAQEVSERFDLYTVPLLGTAADGVKLNPPIAPEQDVVSSRMRFSADGTRILFTITSRGALGHTLYSAPVDGSAAAVGLDGPLDSGGRTFDFAVSGPQVVLQRREDSDEPYQIWTVPVGGGTKVRLSAGPYGPDGAGAPKIAPGGSRVVYVQQNVDGTPEYELWSATIAGPTGNAVLLADVSAFGGNLSGSVKFTPDGSRVVFFGDRDTDTKDELYSVPTAGGTPPVKLNTGLIAAGDVLDFQLSDDGSTVVYTADWAVDEAREIFSVPIAGPSAASVRLNRTLTSGEITILAGIFGDDIVYAVGTGTVAEELRGAPITGPASAEWSILVPETLLSGPGIILAERSVFRADPVTAGEFALWAVENNGLTALNNIYSPFWGSVELGVESGVTPDESEFFFLAAIDGGPLHLYITETDGGQTIPQRLSLVPTGAGGVIDEQYPLEPTPDGMGILYEADVEFSGREELYIADAQIFAADFDEEGDTSEWTSTTP